MKTIWKFPLMVDDHVTIEMPKDPNFLCVQTINNKPFIYAEVDDEAEKEDWIFCIRGTGHPFRGNEGKYLGTVQINYGSIHVFHIYLAKEK